MPIGNPLAKLGEIASKVGEVASKVGEVASKIPSRLEEVAEEERRLAELLRSEGADFPRSDYKATEPKEWMGQLDLDRVKLRDIVWPGTHDSATDEIGIELVTRPLAQCQSLSIFGQLELGVRAVDIRIEQNRKVCHGILTSYHVQRVIDDVKRFVRETTAEFVILEIRTEYGHEDPEGFEAYLVDELGESLIAQEEQNLDRPLRDLLPKRVLCIWKPQKAAAPAPGSLLWSSSHIKDNWVDVDLPHTKFQKNLENLEKHGPAHARNYFYRVENTCTPQADNPIVFVKPVTAHIQPYARLFVSQAHKKGLADHLQIFSTDFVDADFVNICIGLTLARTSG
jgi:hypothetical protein